MQFNIPVNNADFIKLGMEAKCALSHFVVIRGIPRALIDLRTNKQTQKRDREKIK